MSLSNSITSTLSADNPDLITLEQRVSEELAFSVEDAQKVIRGVVAALNNKLFPPITHIELIHTEGCNLGCTYCFEQEMLGYRRMAPEISRAAVDLLFDNSGDATHLTIVHFGGEPTLNFNGIHLVTEYAELRAIETGKSLEFNLTSNGVLLNEEMVDYFALHNIRVLLSIDGLQESHDLYRRDKRGRGTFERVLEGMTKLKRKQPWIGAKMTVMPENAGRVHGELVFKPR